MNETIFTFPRGFLWGTATSSQQVEGNNYNNNWSFWEKEPGRVLNGEQAGLACDWWGGRWREDMDRAAETGQNAHRLSVEWSRIQPDPDRWDEDALDYYRQIIRGMLDRGIQPMVTLHHFSDPIWFSESGGWENEQAIYFFQKYVNKVASALKEYCSWWCTINEPNIYVLGGYLAGVFPPGKKNLFTAYKVLINLARAHALAYHEIHSLQPGAQVGFALNYRVLYPEKAWNPLDRFIVRLFDGSFNRSFPDAAFTGRLRFFGFSTNIPQAKNTMDYFGLNYYSGDIFRFALNPAEFFSCHYYPQGMLTSENGFIGLHPRGIFEAINRCRKYNRPILITENGVEDSTDKLRPRYLLEHINQICRAINVGYPVKGYFHWSLVDNFEWERGWTQRFGLWGLDRDTQKRIRRPSVDLYERICRQNSFSRSLVEEYSPDSIAAIFP